MRVAVIVITRNRSSYIGETFEALTRQDHPDFEILVVDSSTDQEREKTAELAARYGAKYVSEPRRGQALARNTGVSHTSAEIVAFTDDDCVPASNWLSQSLKNFADPSVWACTGRVVQHHKEGAANLFEEVAGQDLGGDRRVFTKQDTFFGIGFLLKNLTKVFAKHMKSGAPIPFGIGHGSSMIFRSETFKQLGNFNIQFGNSAVKYAIEDTELFYRILKSGHTIVYEPAAVVSHKHKLTAEEVFKTRYIYSYTGSALMWRHRRDARMFFMFSGRLVQLLIKNAQYRILRNESLSQSFKSDLRGFLDGWAACRQLEKDNSANPTKKVASPSGDR
jgi:glycosyltransferase involved in cell wall biosynthesis